MLFNVLLILVITFMPLKNEIVEKNYEHVFVGKEIRENVEKQLNVKSSLQTIYGNLTGYGPDCVGCSGRTASGYDVKNTIYYNDREFGKIRIVASDPSIPIGSIVKITGLRGNDPFFAIVLDRGGDVGYGRLTLFDLLYPSESSTESHGIQKVRFDIYRYGY
mgnify:CR=1 FL=1